jgi:hypothetical protein
MIGLCHQTDFDEGLGKSFVTGMAVARITGAE